MSDPIVLVHGIFGFGQLTLAGMKVAEYFRGIPEALREAGYTVPTPPQLNPAGKIVERAGDLQRYLCDPANTAVFQKKVHLIAHSMGGLDSRYMISNSSEMAQRVLSLTTISTPHHGSPIGDLAVAGVNSSIIAFIKDHLGLNVTGISDLTTAACARFNQSVHDVATVRYFSIAGQFTPSRFLNVPVDMLGLTHDIIQKADGANDGMVSVNSATFGERAENWKFLGPLEGDHFRVINWGTNIIPSRSESMDSTIVDAYRNLAATITQA